MSAPDVVALADRALERTAPPFADPASRRRGTLQTALRAQQHRRNRLSALIDSLQQDLAEADEAIVSLERELGCSP